MSTFGSQQFMGAAKPFNELNPSGQSTSESLQLLTQLGEGSRDRANQRTITAMGVAQRERESQQQAELARRDMALQEKHWQDQQAQQRDELQYRHISEKLAREYNTANEDLNDIRDELSDALMVGDEARIAAAEAALNKRNQTMAELGKNQKGIGILKMFREGMAGVAGPDGGKSLVAQMLEDTSGLAKAEFEVTNELQKQLETALLTPEPVVAQPAQGFLQQVFGAISSPVLPKEEGQNARVKALAAVIAKASAGPDAPGAMPLPGMENKVSAIQASVESMLKNLDDALKWIDSGSDSTDSNGRPAQGSSSQALIDAAVVDYNNAVQAGADEHQLSRWLGRVSRTTSGLADATQREAAQKALEGGDEKAMDSKPSEKIAGMTAKDRRLQRGLALLDREITKPDGSKGKLLQQSYYNPYDGDLEWRRSKVGASQKDLMADVSKIAMHLLGTEDPREAMRLLSDNNPDNDPIELKGIKLAPDVKKLISNYLIEQEKVLTAKLRDAGFNEAGPRTDAALADAREAVVSRYERENLEANKERMRYGVRAAQENREKILARKRDARKRARVYEDEMDQFVQQSLNQRR